jgi:hypothetical protein
MKMFTVAMLSLLALPTYAQDLLGPLLDYQKELNNVCNRLIAGGNKINVKVK